MDGHIKESDWKIFSNLQRVALERYCQRVLSQITAVANDEKRTYHERYQAIYGLIQKRDRELADAFDGPSRSTALIKLMLMRRLGLVTDQEFAGFSSETSQIISKWLEVTGQ